MRMISRRIFFSICIMMVAILVLFQFSIVGRDLANNYGENIHMTGTKLTRADTFDEESLGDDADVVLYIGGEDDAAGRIISQWCRYTRRKFTQYDSLEDYYASGTSSPLLLCLSGEAITTAGQTDELSAKVQAGQHVLLCDIPEVDELRQNRNLRTLMGIRTVESDEIELTGIHLYSGFLLGDETIYLVEEEEEKLNQEIHISAPWFRRLSGTKCFMAGLLEDESVDNEDLPSLIWRNSYGDGRVFIVNGPYMQDETGLGILSAIMHELQDYILYPVVNAQNLSITNFPVLAFENTEELMNIYARDMYHLQSNLMWPDMILATSRGGYKMTNFLTPRLDYIDKADLQTDTYVFYLRQFREQTAEAALSLDFLPGIGLKDKLREDKAFFDAAGSTYHYSAAYVGSNNIRAYLAVDEQNLLKNLYTVTGTWSNADILSYSTDTITAQGVTADGFLHTYLQDLRVKAIETALGYSNILLDMKNIAWPNDDDLHWEVLSDILSSNINTYWKPFYHFDMTSLTESDERVRKFFAVDYTNTRQGNTITLELKNDDDHWFLLRTHAEDIKSIIGGEYIMIEEDAYLIHTLEKSVRIELEEWQKKRYYLP